MASKSTKIFSKKSDFLLILISVLYMLMMSAMSSNAAVTITKPTLNIITGVYPSAYNALGNIIITEGAAANYSAGTNITLILSAPANFEFQAGVGNVSYIAAKNITAATVAVTASTITVTYSVVGTGINGDALTISGIMVRAVNGSSSGSVTRTGGTGVINGDANGAVHAVLSSDRYCASTSAGGAYEYISGVVMTGGISNTGTGRNNYTNYSGTQISSVTLSQAVTLTISSISTWANDIAYVYIDYNQDGDWADAGELVASGSGATSPYTLNFTIPAGATVGTTRMRIKFGSTSDSPGITNDPCQASFQYGEVEDYGVNISASCVMPTISSVVPTNPTCSSNNGQIVINSSGTVTDYSIDNGNTWTGSTNNTYTFSNLTAGSYNIKVRNTASCITSYTGNSVTLAAPPAMAFVSSTTTQTVTSPVAPFSIAQQIIGIQIVTSGSCSPFDATSFTFNTNGTTNAANDIICATLYCTGNSSTFGTAISFGSVISQPNGTFTFNGDSYTLSSGTNYFWLTYNVPLAATIGNMLDAECTSIIVNGNTYTPSVTNPGSGRPIANIYLHNNSDAVSSCSGGYYDDGGQNGIYAQGTHYAKTFIADAGKFMRITFSSFATESGVDLMKIYDGPSTSSPIKGTWSGTSSPGTVTASSSTGELTVDFVSDNYTQTYAGWEAIISCVNLLPNCIPVSPAPTPADGSTNLPCNTSITWTAPAVDATHNPATSYKLYFGTDPAATNMYNGVDIGNVTSWGTFLNTNTTYYWRVVPVNRSGDASGCSTVRSFTTNSTTNIITMNVNGVNNPPTSYQNIKTAYDACTTSAPYLIVVKTGYSGESYPIHLDKDVASVVNNRTSANPIIIRPDAGFSYTFSGTDTIIVLRSGAKYVTIDGRQGGTGTANSFVFANTSTTKPVICFSTDNSYNTVKYCKIQGGNQNSGIVDIKSPVGSGIRFDTIKNNEICPNTGLFPTCGIYSGGTAALLNTGITVSNNNIHDIWADVAGPSRSINFDYNIGSDINYGCTISGNSIYFTSSKTPVSNSTAWYGIYGGGLNLTISNNYIGGTDALCGGAGPLTILGTKENHIYGIIVRGFSAASSTAVSSNTVRNISLSSTHRSMDQLTNRIASSDNQTLAGIVIEEGAASVSNNNIGGTTAGDITVINTNTTDGTPTLTTNYQAGSENNWGYSAELVGLVYNSKLGIINNGGNTIQGLKCYSSNNGANINCRIIGVLASTDNAVNTGYIHNISYDIIGGTGGLIVGISSNTGDGFIWGIKTATGKGSIYINHNIISNLQVLSTGPYGFIRGIHNDGGIRCEIEYNTVFNLACASPNSLPVAEAARRRVIVGIMCDNDGGYLDHFFVNKNTVYDLRSTTTTSTKVDLIGIYYRHAAAPVYGRVFANKVYSINAKSTDMSSILVGIWGYGQNTITYNNMVTLGNDVSTADGAGCPAGSPVNTNGYELRGIENYFGKNEYYFNTINIIGTTGIGASNSYAYKYNNGVSETWCRVIKDNIFSNTRSSISGTAKHYAFSVNSYENCYSSDYNYYYVTGINGVLFDHNGTDRTTIASWTAATPGQDAHSSGTSVTASPDPLFTSPTGCTCDLNITNPASPIHNAGNNTGIPSFILDDIYGNPRAGTHDIGAVVIGGLLPVELFSFTAEKYNDSKAQIEWVTTSETNNSSFTVERSLDGITFENIAIVDGAGNSNTVLSYKAFDNKPVNGMNYYRLKQTDYDGQYSYSQTVPLDFSSNGFSANIYPNPFNDFLYVDIQGNLNDDTILSIYDMTGKLISEKNINSSGNHVLVQMGHEIPEGFYIIKIHNSQSMKYYKVIKRKE